jgi:hypothetical protein
MLTFAAINHVIGILARVELERRLLTAHVHPCTEDCTQTVPYTDIGNKIPAT